MIQQLVLDKDFTEPAYKQPYYEWVDNKPFARGFKSLDFANFIDEDEQPTIEHDGRFIAQYIEAGTMGF